jgi:hypothetical protein
MNWVDFITGALWGVVLTIAVWIVATRHRWER